MAAGLAIGGAAVVASTSVSGQTALPADPIDYAADLTIDLAGRDGKVVLAEEGKPPIDETIVTEQPCAAIRPSSGNLLRFSANAGTSSADTVQIDNSALGVLTANTSCGTANAGTINRSESLTIDLGPYFDSKDVVAESVTLNFDRFQRGDLRVGFDGGPLTTYSGLPYPSQIVLTPSTPFTSMTVSSTATNNAGVSVVDMTSFSLTSNFDFAVGCGEFVQADGDVGDVATKVVYLRGQNETDPAKFTQCQDVGVIVEVLTEAEATGGVPDGLGGRVFWDNSFVGVDGVTPQAVQGTVRIEWAPVFIGGLTQAEIEAILDREIDYDAGGPAPATDTLWCDSFTNESDFDLPFYDGPGANADDTAPWCLVSDERVLTNRANPETGLSEPAIVQVEKLAGKGDPWRF